MSATNFVDLTGQKFGRLTVIERAENKGSQTYWKCRCDCGNVCVVNAYSLKTNHTKSCGCFREKFAVVHGKYKTKIYRIWSAILQRCLNPNVLNYARYGGRGITMYPEWINNFQAFYDYVSKLEHYGEKGYSLDRIDNNGNYEPDNLRWADAKTQARNTRRNVFVEYKGVKMTLAEVAELSEIKIITLWKRYQRGDIGERLFRPVETKIHKNT